MKRKRQNKINPSKKLNRFVFLIVSFSFAAVGIYMLVFSKAESSIGDGGILVQRQISNTTDGSSDAVLLYNPTTGASNEFTALEKTTKVAQFSPSGSQIAYLNTQDNCKPYLINSDGTNKRKLSDNISFASDLKWSPDGNYLAILSIEFIKDDVAKSDTNSILNIPSYSCIGLDNSNSIPFNTSINIINTANLETNKIFESKVTTNKKCPACTLDSVEANYANGIAWLKNNKLTYSFVETKDDYKSLVKSEIRELKNYSKSDFKVLIEYQKDVEYAVLDSNNKGDKLLYSITTANNLPYDVKYVSFDTGSKKTNKFNNDKNIISKTTFAPTSDRIVDIERVFGLNNNVSRMGYNLIVVDSSGSLKSIALPGLINDQPDYSYTILDWQMVPK